MFEPQKRFKCFIIWAKHHIYSTHHKIDHLRGHTSKDASHIKGERNQWIIVGQAVSSDHWTWILLPIPHKLKHTQQILVEPLKKLQRLLKITPKLRENESHNLYFTGIRNMET